MDEILLQLGLQDNEITVYLLLLASPRLTAQQIAERTGIKRTNTYRVIDSLIEQGLIARDASPVSKFSAAEPQRLQKILEEKQLALKQTAKSLSAVMPSFRSQYSLSLDKPGVYHMAGDEGFERLLTDMISSQTEVLLVASDDVPNSKETLSRFRRLQGQIRDNGVMTRALFHDASYKDRIRKEFQERGMETRFIGDSPFKGEIVIYENNVVFVVYDPSLVVTVITNQHIVATMRILFEQVWAIAK
jgi:sugar-specific transcriptional regulator TrmB